jgi:N-acetylneuraminate epimerase
MFAVAAVQDGSFFLFSGSGLHADANGKAVRTYLRDAYRFTPGQGWRRVADLPRAANAAPSPALAIGKSSIAIVSGSDGNPHANLPPAEHPGFSRNVLVYDAKQDTWSLIEHSPVSLATIPVVKWGDRHVIPGGEVRPRVRTPAVWSITGSD